MTCPYDSLKATLNVGYSGDGSRISRDFIIPILKKSISYSRLSGYFSTNSLIVTAAGLAGLIQNGGHMKLVVGAHDVNQELSDAYELSETRAKELLEQIGENIAQDLEGLTDLFAKSRLEALAWMLVNNRLEIRVAIPKKTYHGRGNGIFHDKMLIFEDTDGCTVTAVGSANETRSAYEVNGESLWLHMSWRPGADAYIQKHKGDFSAIWHNDHSDYIVFSLPEAIKLKLRERFYSPEPPALDPLEREEHIKKRIPALLPVARFVNEVASLKGFTHLGLGPVRLYPHQAFAADFVLSRFPYRCLIADEVGLGKTLEAGSIIKRLIDERQVERVLILAPKNVTRQWMEELYTHFGLRFRLFESSPHRRFVDPDHEVIHLGKTDSPFSLPGVDCIIMSWHYARRDDVKELLLGADRGFDLVVVDEAHAARKKRIPGRPPEPTKLNDLCMEIGISCPHLLLLTATPVQLRSLEALDLLRILGLGGRWVHETNFERFYDILQKDDEDIEDSEWAFALQMIQSFAVKMLAQEDVEKLIVSAIPGQHVDEVVRMMRTGGNIGHVVSLLKSEKTLIVPSDIYVQELPYEVTVLRRLIMSFSPLQWYMVRNTRRRLERVGFHFPERKISEEAVELNADHAALLEQLDDYLQNQYAAYEQYLGRDNRGTLGFVRCIYHQRFVSSFSAAYQTVVNRLEFLNGLLNNDTDALLRVAERLFVEEEGDDVDEVDFVEAVREMLGQRNITSMIRTEQQALEHLKTTLTPYAPGNVSLDDPKLSKIYEVVSHLVYSEQRKVLVFSKYLDTIGAIHQFFLERGYAREEIALYSGSGGSVYDKTRGCYEKVGKEEVRRALEGNDVNIVLCTDAASEGLNLQAASAIINVDMPWNPAKVEQRIGRIDRLGQTSPCVTVVNTWYPTSIEASMYSALFSRREIYQLVVGPAQDIFSEQLRRAFDENARGERLKQLAEETVEEIGRIKEAATRAEGVFTGVQWDGVSAEDEAVIQRTAAFIRTAAPVLGFTVEERDARLYITGGTRGIPADLDRWNGASLAAGRANALTPAHPIVKWFVSTLIRMESKSGKQSVFPASLYVVKDARKIGTLIKIEGDGGFPEEVPGSGVVQVMDALLAHARGDAA